MAKRQPRPAAVTKPTASGSATRFVSAALIATRSANEPGPVNPGWVCCGQTCASPARQYSHGSAAADERHRHPVPGPPAFDLRAHLDDGARELVTGNVRQLDRVVPLPGVPVRAAHAVAPTARTTPSAGQAGSGASVSTGIVPYSE